MCDLFGKSFSCCLLAASAVNVLEIFCQIFCLANFVQSEIYLIKAILLSPLRLLLLQQLCMIYVIYSTLPPRHCLSSLSPLQCVLANVLALFARVSWPETCCLLPSACLNFTSYWLYYTRLSRDSVHLCSWNIICKSWESDLIIWLCHFVVQWPFLWYRINHISLPSC